MFKNHSLSDHLHPITLFSFFATLKVEQTKRLSTPADLIGSDKLVHRVSGQVRTHKFSSRSKGSVSENGTVDSVFHDLDFAIAVRAREEVKVVSGGGRSR